MGLFLQWLNFFLIFIGFYLYFICFLIFFKCFYLFFISFKVIKNSIEDFTVSSPRRGAFHLSALYALFVFFFHDNIRDDGFLQQHFRFCDRLQHGVLAGNNGHTGRCVIQVDVFRRCAHLLGRGHG